MALPALLLQRLLLLLPASKSQAACKHLQAAFVWKIRLSHFGANTAIPCFTPTPTAHSRVTVTALGDVNVKLENHLDFISRLNHFGFGRLRR